MWFKNIFRQKNKSRARAKVKPLFDEQFLRRLERMSLQAQRTLRGNPSGGEHLSRQQILTTIFNDHRPYVRGDDVRYVDWNAYARQGHMLVKLGEAEQNVDVHLLLDTSHSMTWGQPPKLYAAQQLVGALGYLSLTQSDRVSIVPFGSSMLPPFGPVQGKARVVEMLRYITTVASQQQTSLSVVLKRYAQTHPRGGMLVLCSDLLASEGLDDGLRALPPPRWQVLIFHVLDPRELRPEIQGPLELEDIETGQRLPLTLDTITLATYRRRVQQWQEHLARVCAQRGASYTRILTTWPLEQKIVPYLRTRRLLS